LSAGFIPHFKLKKKYTYTRECFFLYVDFFFSFPNAEMYNNVEAQSAASKPLPSSQPNPFGNAFYGAGSGLIRGGLGAYGEKIFGSSSEYVQSNVSTS